MQQGKSTATRRFIIAVASAKGGTGKTSLAANLAATFALSDMPVAVLDLDPQDALYAHLDPVGGHSEGIVGASLDGRHWADIARYSPNGAMVLPYGKTSHTAHQVFERALVNEPDWLAQGLDSLDLSPNCLVVLDTSSTMSGLSAQALGLADLVLIPLLADAASYATVPAMRQLLDAYPPRHDRGRESLYIVNQLDAADELSRDVARLMRRELASRLGGEVAIDPVFRRAHASRCSIFDYDANSRGANDLLACARVIARRFPVTQDA
ncbi:cellulose biosynthesis protein BcsQ [Pigmentiphaga aceris]|nr:cellulose biosynthesis protein BcsQ [Pigmentiphaga aceris]